MESSNKRKAWLLDQLAKSEYFHHKLHEWKMLEVAAKIEEVKGETLSWNLEELSISQTAWNKIIHRGIKPVIVFAHPEILKTIRRAVSYYRMMAMVSQKSMKNIKLKVDSYEDGKDLRNEQIALEIARVLNKIISILIETDEKIDAREFDLWRGMAAGTQAQGSSHNVKGRKAEILIKNLLQKRLINGNWIDNKIAGLFEETVIQIKDGRKIKFAKDPDVGVYEEEKILAAVEIKGGIDPAASLERFGAALKSLSRAKEANPESKTILILTDVSITERVRKSLNENQKRINHWFILEELTDLEEKQEELFSLLAI